jgi:hypothetical protein
MTRAFSTWARHGSAGAHTVRSDDGVLQLDLRLVDAGLYMQRELRRPRAGRVTQANIFASREAFARWCEADPLRFEYPMVHARLLRLAGRLFDDHGTACAAG